MSRNFVLTVLVATALFIGAYLAWTTWLFPRPLAMTDTGVKQNAVARPAVNVNPTIVPAQTNAEGIPLKLSELVLADSAKGKDALGEFTKLHGQPFELNSGYRASYAKGTNRATLWVAQAKDADSAQKLLLAMAEKIGVGNEMFTDLQELTVGGRTLFQVNGQGQLHFFYATNDKIVWLAIDAEYAPDALHSLWSAVK